jgi:HAD superfamily hydrolase (TIGR01509 family)
MTPESAEALLFDCDGTLVHSLAAYEAAWIRAFADHGVRLAPGWFRARVGTSPRAMIAAAAIDHDVTLDVDAVEAQGVAAFVASAHTVLPNDPVLDIARAQRGRVPLAVVTGAPRVAALAALAAVDALELFDHVVTIEDVETGKPAPDLYLHALARVNRPAEACLAYEDSDEGLDAAAAAGIPVVDVRTLLDGQQALDATRPIC